MRQVQDDRTKDRVIRSTVRIQIPLRKQSEALEILGSVREEVRFEPGCISSRLYRGVDDARIVMMEDVWSDMEEMQRHFQSEAYRRVLLVIEMADKPPEICFDTVIRSSGMEYVMRARSSG